MIEQARNNLQLFDNVEIIQSSFTDIVLPSQLDVIFSNSALHGYRITEGHQFYPSSQWSTGKGPIQQYVLADIYAWFEAHSGFTSPAAAARIPTSSIPSSNSTAK
jgi:hypothetical protein